MTKLAQAVVSIGSDIADFEAGLALVQEEMQKAGKTLETLGKEMALKVTLPLAAIGALAVKEFGQQEDAITKLNAVLQATGGVAGTTVSAVRALAESLQESTRFTDTEVIAAAGLLATFQQVRNEVGLGNDVFDRAIRTSADLAATMGGDLSEAALQLGRALEDPATGLMLLRRAGIQFSAAEQAQIKILIQHGQVLEAQRIVLDKVESKTKGVAAAMAATPLGHFAQAWNEVKSALQPVGGILATVLVPLADLVKSVASAFKNLSPEIMRVVVIMATAVAAIGPVLIAWAGLLKIWAMVKTVVGLGMVPTLGLLVAALGAVVAAGMAIVDNWAWIKVQVVSLWTLIKDAFFTGIEWLLGKVQELGQLAQSIPAVARALVPGLGAVSDIMLALGNAAGDMKTRVEKAHEAMLASAGGQLSRLEADYQAVIDKMVQAMQAGKKGPKGDDTREPGWLAPTIEALDKLRSALVASDQMTTVLGREFDSVGAKSSAYQAAIQALQNAHVGLDQTLSSSKPEVQAFFATMLSQIKALDPAFVTTDLTLRSLIKRFQELTAEGALTTLHNDLQTAQDQAAALGRQFDLTGAQASAYGSVVSALQGAHIDLDKVLDTEGNTLRKLLVRYKDLSTKSMLTNLQSDLAGVSAQEAVLGMNFDASSAKAQVYQGVISSLIAAHRGLDEALDANGTTLRDLITQMQDFQDKAKIGSFFQDEFGKATDALVDFANGGKLMLGQFIREMVVEFTKLIVKMELMRLIAGIGGAADISAPDIGTVDTSGIPAPHLAAGGFLSPGQLGLVGESGPEVIRAGRAGATIAPISAARGTDGQGATGERMTLPVTINVSAIDSKDVAQFFEENQGLVGATMLKAVQRSRLLRQGLG